VGPTLIGILGLVFMLVLMFLGIPIGVAFVIPGMLGVALLAGFKPAITMLGTVTYSQMASYTWAVIPLFMLMGELVAESGLTADAYDAASKWLGRVPGGLCHATTAAATLFAAVSGSAVVSSVAMTKLSWPEMKRYGYEPGISLGSILCAGTIAFLIPPSIPMVIYAMLAEESVGKLFIAGIVPGILTAFLIVITVAILVVFNPRVAPPGPVANWRQRFTALLQIWPILTLVIFVMGSIWAGICTPNEAAGVGCLLAIFIAWSRDKLSWRGLTGALQRVTILGGGMFVMFVGIQVFNTFLTLTMLPQMLATWVAGLDLSPTAVLWVIVIVYMILGIPLEVGPILLLTVPIFVPLLVSLGIDKVLFGVLSTITVGLAFMTPPVGAPLFLVHAIVQEEGISLNTIFRGAAIFCVPILVSIILLILFPQLALWLPGTMYGQ
jgi:tripartite ATP-independent transporter DctM subunit